MVLTNRMGALLNRIHARAGDHWWYSAMIFVACPSGDAINAFIGLWLRPEEKVVIFMLVSEAHEKGKDSVQSTRPREYVFLNKRRKNGNAPWKIW